MEYFQIFIFIMEALQHFDNFVTDCHTSSNDQPEKLAQAYKWEKWQCEPSNTQDENDNENFVTINTTMALPCLRSQVPTRHVHGSEMTQIWDPYSGNGSGDTALINAAMYGAWIPPKHACQFC